MWLPVSTFAALCVLLDVVDGTVSDKQLDLVFQDRSRSDWEEAWHRERYSRCRETLIKHLYWACEKDIYRITRRSQPDEMLTYADDVDSYVFPWITAKRARTLVRSSKKRSSRRSGSSITAECCSRSGCTWEEYAEYCPTNKRHTKFV